MTESDWINATDPQSMLEFLHAKGMLSERKARLFAVACCRRSWHDLDDARSRVAIEVAERLADGLASEEDRQGAEQAARDATYQVVHAELSFMSKPGYYGGVAAIWATRTLPDQAIMLGASTRATWAAGRRVLAGAVEGGDWREVRLAAEAKESDAQQHLFRCIFANPLRPASIDPAWLTPTVTNLATAAYDNRLLPSGHLDPARLAVLSDAVEESGCQDAAILEHLRSDEPHVRGCWVLDAVLGKS